MTPRKTRPFDIASTVPADLPILKRFFHDPGKCGYGHQSGCLLLKDWSFTLMPTVHFRYGTPPETYWTRPGESELGKTRPPYVFTEAEVWDGLRHTEGGRSVPFCNGLLYDWSKWIHAGDDNAESMAAVLRTLSPDRDTAHMLRPGPPLRLSVDDTRDIPSIQTDHAGQVPVIHASSGVRRIVALAYMLTWTWSEHRIASKLEGRETVSRSDIAFRRGRESLASTMAAFDSQGASGSWIGACTGR